MISNCHYPRKIIVILHLGPKADPEKHPEYFYQGLRLCGVDGTMFSVSNTPQIKRTLTKSQTRHLKAAFAKIGAVTIFELGVHNPLAAAIGTRGQSEMVLANQIIDQLPPQSLLIADRYYGSAEVIHRFRQWQGDEGSHFLFRVKANLKASIVETYPDGSALVEIGKGESKMRVREIKARVRRPGKAWTDVRLWTSLLNWQRDGAQTLLKLYSGRWEHEIAYKELKVDMRSARLLQSHTEATAAQEIAALIIGYSILAQKRMEVASHAELPVLRISFRKTWETVQGLWQFLEVSEGIINRRQTKEIINKAMDQIAELIIPERRERSCPRAIRQPVSSRPRLKRNTYQHGPVQCEVLQPPI